MPPRLALALPIALVSAIARPAFAYPLLPPHPVPSAIAGPTDPVVASVFYNPAALGPLRGFHFFADGAARLHLGAVDRAPIEGRPGGSASIVWVNPGSFAGMSWDFYTDRVTVALAGYAPFVELSSYGASSPLRYHEIRQSFATLEQTLSAAFRVTSRWFIGAGFNLSQTWFDYRFAWDAALAGGPAGVDRPGGLCGDMPCGLENPLAAELMRFRGFNWAWGLSVGLLYRPIDRLWLGLAYHSRMYNLGDDRGLTTHDARRGSDLPILGSAAVTTSSGAALCPARGTPDNLPCDFLVRFSLPDIVYLGARLQLRPGLELEAAARYVHYGRRSQLDINLDGGRLAELGVTAPPSEFRIDRGLTDAYAFEGSVRLDRGRLRLAPSAVFETSAVESTAVSPAAIDAPKLDLMLAASWRVFTHLVLAAHAGVTSYFLRNVASRYDPRAQVACIDARYSLDACGAVLAGDGLPSASGRYLMFVLHVGAGLGLEY